MYESLITISIAGLIAGFILSMPIAGPISILITSNALKGRQKYCNLVAIGASFSDFLYVFIAVLGLTRLYALYKPFIPFLLIAGAVFLFYTGFKIFRTKIDMGIPDKKSHLYDKFNKKERGGFYTGLMLNLLNPTLLLGWLTSSFIVITLVSSLGFNTGGSETTVKRNVNKLNKIQGDTAAKQKMPAYLQFKTNKPNDPEVHKQEPKKYPRHFHLFISLCYAFFVALGGIIWFYLLTFLLVKLQNRIKVDIVKLIIHGLGITLCLIAMFFAYTALRMFL